jgi:hypothetical protein
MPPSPTGPRRVKPVQSSETEESATPAPAPKYPWSSPASVVDKQGLSMMLFAMPGVGKTTLGLSMIESLDGGPMLIVNTDEELRSISDLSDDSGVMVWPGAEQNGKIRNWAAFNAFTGRLLTGSHPFKHIMFDTLNSLYEKFALPDVKARNPGAKDPRQIYGEANDMVLGFVRNFCGIAREKGTNIVFTCHAEEKQVGEDGPIYIRPKVTPGVILGINQAVSLIGYLAPPSLGKPRTLQLAASRMIATKIHQPRTGPQIPDKVIDPNLGKLIDHMKHHKPYPTKKKGDD